VSHAYLLLRDRGFKGDAFPEESGPGQEKGSESNSKEDSREGCGEEVGNQDGAEKDTCAEKNLNQVAAACVRVVSRKILSFVPAARGTMKDTS
jgi:hypothetical protein